MCFFLHAAQTHISSQGSVVVVMVAVCPYWLKGAGARSSSRGG